jgi:hypothetical protein
MARMFGSLALYPTNSSGCSLKKVRSFALKADLATTMLSRMIKLAAEGGSVAAVTPQNWFYLGSYTALRRQILENFHLNLVCDLGPAAFHEMNWWAARASLLASSNVLPNNHSSYFGLDADTGRDLDGKARILSTGHVRSLKQQAQIRNPDHRILVKEPAHGTLLAEYADVYVGFQNGDTLRWVQQFWEQTDVGKTWSLFQLTSDTTQFFDGRHSIIKWEGGYGILVKSDQARIQGTRLIPLSQVGQYVV